jgi:hypothetical protein
MKQRYSCVPIKLSLHDSRLTLQNLVEFAQLVSASPQRFVQYTYFSAMHNADFCRCNKLRIANTWNANIEPTPIRSTKPGPWKLKGPIHSKLNCAV